MASIPVRASEALAAGDFVNFHNSSGKKVRKTNATAEGKEADGFVLASVSGSPPAISVVQSVSVNLVNDGPKTLALTGVAAGNTLMLLVSHSEATTNNAPSSITGMAATLDATSSSAVLNNFSQFPAKSRIYRENNVTAGGKSVVVSFVGESYGMLTLVEVAGLNSSAPLDITLVSGNGTSTAPATGSSSATTLANEIVFAIMVQNSTSVDGASTIGTPSGYTQLGEKESGVAVHHAYKIVAATGAQSATWSSNKNDPYNTALATYKAIPDGGGTAEVWLRGAINNALSGLTPDTFYALSTTGGLVVAAASAPSASGNVVQIVGKALSATEIMFDPQLPITRA